VTNTNFPEPVRRNEFITILARLTPEQLTVARAYLLSLKVPAQTAP